MRLSKFSAMWIVLSAGVLLSACGGSSGDSASTPAPSTDDAFVTTVRQQTDTAIASSDTAEPVDITNVMVTSPDATEPQSVTF